jgi:hypothetical protein
VHASASPHAKEQVVAYRANSSERAEGEVWGSIAEPAARSRVIDSRRPVDWQTNCSVGDELVIACEKARDDLGGRELIVDLRSLTRIGPEGERVLLQLMKDKIKLQCGALVRELLTQLVRSNQLNTTDASEALNDED